VQKFLLKSKILGEALIPTGSADLSSSGSKRDSRW